MFIGSTLSLRMVFVSVILFLVSVGMAGAVTPINSCTTITSPGVYVLNNGIGGSSGNCITIESSNVIFDGQQNTITGTGSSGTGISVSGRSWPSNVTVKNVAVTGWQFGIYYLTIDRGSITNNTASNNNYGIYLWDSNRNNITNNTASNNGNGIFLGASSSNTLTNNNANSNNNYGIWLDNSGYYSDNNTIYNNFFNNTNNFGFYGTGYSNTWNTTRTSGPNIVGGPYLGGNFWAKPDGTGFSETCTDADRDGICDSSYTLASENVDYLPLTILPVDVTTTVIPRLDYYFNITWTIPPDPELEEFNIYQRLNDNSSTDILIATVPANYTQPYVAGPGYDDGSLYQYMVTPVNTSGSEGSGAYAPKGLPAPPIPFAPLGTLLTLGGGLAAYGWYRRKMI